MGATAESYKSSESAKSITSDYIILEVRELENLFYSDSFFDGLNIDATLKRDIQEKMDRILTIDPDFENYYDMKAGYTKKSISLKPELQKRLESSACCSEPEKKKCANCKSDACGTNVMKGYGRKIIDQIGEKYKTDYDHTIFFTDAQKKVSRLDNEWSRIGNVLFLWGCQYQMKTRRI